MFWKLYKKGCAVHFDKVWYVAGATAEYVHECESEGFDFEILVKADEED